MKKYIWRGIAVYLAVLLLCIGVLVEAGSDRAVPVDPPPCSFSRSLLMEQRCSGLVMSGYFSRYISTDPISSSQGGSTP